MNQFATNTHLIILFVSAIGCSGCKLTNHHHKSQLHPHHDLCHEQSSGTITTGGVYARRRVLEIPSSGLTLGDAVEASLRPGLRQPLILVPTTPQAAIETPAQRGLPLISSTALLENSRNAIIELQDDSDRLTAIESIASNFRSDSYEAIEAISNFLLSTQTREVVKKFQGPRAGNSDEVVLDQLLQTMKLSDDRVTVEANDQFSDIQTVFQDLVESLGDQRLDRASIKVAFKPAINNAIILEAVSAWTFAHRSDLTSNDSSRRENLLRRLLALNQSAAFVISRDPQPGDAESPPSSASAMTPTATAPSAAVTQPTVNAVVMLRRSGTATRIIPLAVVQSTPVGDIALAEGDRVGVNPFSRTSVGSRTASNGSVGSIALSGILSASLDLSNYQDLRAVSDLVATQDLGPLVDIMILGAPGDDGEVEEYWFPRNAAAALCNTHGPELSTITLRDSDALRVTAIELTPIVRRSRLIQRIEQLDQQRQTRLRQKLQNKAAQGQAFFGSLTENSLYQSVSRNLNRLSPLSR